MIESLLRCAALTALVVAAGCFGGSGKQSLAQDSKRCYVPEVSLPETPMAAQFPEVKLRQFRAMPPFDSRQFVVCRGGGEYAADYYRAWLGAPEDLIAAQTERYLAAAGLFKAVYDVGSGTITDLGLDGVLTELVLDYRNPQVPVARVGLRLALLDERSPSFAVLFTAEEKAVSPISGNDACQAVSDALQETLKRLTKRLSLAKLQLQ